MSRDSREPVVPVVLGPTGVGKTEVAHALALELGAEIVVADSRQVYRELHIATNHPPDRYREEVPYHMLEVADPRLPYSLYEFLVEARQVIEDIQARGRIPVIEGGSMLYVDGLCRGLSLAGTPPSPGRRRELASLSREELWTELQRLDPDADVDRQNPVRLVRAIEIVEASGRPLVDARTSSPPPWRPLRLGLRAPFEWVEESLLRRCREQIERGLLDETRSALESGVPADAQVLSGIGYREAGQVLSEELRAEDLEPAMWRSNRRYAKRQIAWLNRQPEVHWIEVGPTALRSILDLLKTCGVA